MEREFKQMSSDEKHWMLEEISGKMIELTYDYSDIPDGSMGPKDFVGKICHVGVATFDFEFFNPDDWEPASLTIEGIEAIKVFGWEFKLATKKTRLAVMANLFQYLWYVIFLFI